MNKKIMNKIDEIANEIRKGITNNEVPEHLGLYNGKFGILIFLYYYSMHSKNVDFAKFTDNCADLWLDELTRKEISHTFCSGLSGILYAFEFLQSNNFVHIDTNEVESLFNNHIATKTNINIRHEYYDFMHGGVGPGLYFLKKNINQNIVSKLINSLYKTAEKYENEKITCWKFLVGLHEGRKYNIALSHGISSIVIFLCKTKLMDITNEYLDTLLEGSVNYILTQEINHKIWGSFYPNQSKENISKSRLAWCYGDLGVAYALWQAGKINKNEEWKNKALEIFTFSANRLSIQDAMTQDAGICHGSAGIAMFFNRMYNETHINLFKETTFFWINKTLNYDYFDYGLAGYRTYGNDKDAEDSLNPDYSLLTGISGIGMVLLSYLYGDKQEWDELFLLST